MYQYSLVFILSTVCLSIDSWGMHAPSWVKDGNTDNSRTYSYATKTRKDAPSWVIDEKDTGHLNALASHYANGTDGFKKDENEALRLYTKSIEQGSAEGARGFAEQVIKIAQNSRNPKASFSLGKLYDHGIGVSKDSRLAEQYYLIGAHDGHAGSQFALSMLYTEGGNNINADPNKAFQYLKLSADNNHAEAQCNLGVMHLRNNQDNLGAHYLKLAADQGDSRAQYNLGKLHLLGRGVNGRNDGEAVRLYKLAAKQGHEKANSELKGICRAHHHLKPYPPNCEDYGKK